MKTAFVTIACAVFGLGLGCGGDGTAASPNVDRGVATDAGSVRSPADASPATSDVQLDAAEAGDANAARPPSPSSGEPADASDSGSSANSAYMPRVDFGQRLEPVGSRILHCAGQSEVSEFTSYSALLTNTPPAVYMSYVLLSDPSYLSTIQSQIEGISSALILPQIGLSMTNGANAGYDAEVASGAYDSQISALVQALQAVHRPVYLRIGYEFNGSWNGYTASKYVLAFQRITNAIRAAGLNEVATIWDFNMQGDSNYMQYYPGDAYVDWWGSNVFPNSDFTSSLGKQFLSDATAHRKPVIIGESTPQGVGVLDGQTSWNNWFQGYFDYVMNQPGIKAFCYINRDWTTNGGSLANWGDGQLQDNSVVAANYVAALRDPAFLNLQGVAANLKTALGLPAMP